MQAGPSLKPERQPQSRKQEMSSEEGFLNKLLFHSSDRHRGESDLHKFIDQIHSNHEEMMRPKAEDEPMVLVASYAQVSQSAVAEAMDACINMLKGVERMLEEKLKMTEHVVSLESKLPALLQPFKQAQGTMHNALEELSAYLELHFHQARMSLDQAALHKLMKDMRVLATQRVSEYEKHLALAAKDVQLIDKRLAKLRESQEKLLAKQLERCNATSQEEKPRRRWRDQFSDFVSSIKDKDSGHSSEAGSDAKSPHTSQQFPGSPISRPGSLKQTFSSSALRHNGNPDADDEASPATLVSPQAQVDADALAELIKQHTREKEECAERLLRAIAVEDSVRLGARKAYQSLDRECRSAVCGVLRQYARQEKETLLAKLSALERLERALDALDLDADMNAFIAQAQSSHGGVHMKEHALRMLDSFQNKRKIRESEVGAQDPSMVLSENDPPTQDTIEKWLTSIVEYDASAISWQPNDPFSTVSAQLQGDIKTAVDGIMDCIPTDHLRQRMVFVLNQFRGARADVTRSHNLFAAILWELLDVCLRENDVHTGKIIMMLSQTFYVYTSPPNPEDDTENRVFLKDTLLGHPLWQDLGFWEQAVWQCVVEQFQTLPDSPWYECTPPERSELVQRIHNIIFSQVMAIAHSMVELGCTLGQARSFVDRMCVVHQLTELQRQMLLSHLYR